MPCRTSHPVQDPTSRLLLSASGAVLQSKLELAMRMLNSGQGLAQVRELASNVLWVVILSALRCISGRVCHETPIDDRLPYLVKIIALESVDD